MKRICCLLAALLCFALAGCGSGATVEPAALLHQMEEAAVLPAMKTVADTDANGERGFAAICDLDYDKVEAYSLLYAADGSAYELAVIRLKDAADIAALEQSLKKHIDNRVAQYRVYKPEQVDRAAGAVVAAHGSYAALIMCDDNAAAKAVFDHAFG